MGAHLKALRRTSIDPYRIEDALGSGELEAAAQTLKEKIIPLRYALPQFTEVEVDETTAFRVRRGYQPAWEELREKAPFPQKAMKLVKGADLVALVSFDPGARSQIRVSRVFV